MNLNILQKKKEFLLSSHFATYFKRQSLSVVLLAVSAFLGILILVKVGGFFVVTAKAQTLMEQAVINGRPSAEDTEKYITRYREAANELKKNNLFAPPQEKRHPVKEVSGILGDEALINGKWYKIGDMVADAKIVAIEPAQVRIEWEGSEKSFAPIDASSPAGPGGPRPARADAEVAKQEKGEPAQMVPVQVEVGGNEGMGRFGGFFPGDLAGMRERWENMSEQEREEFRARMRDRFGEGRGPRRGRRGERQND